MKNLFSEGYKLHQGQCVKYNNGLFSGEGVIVGVATTEFPIMGRMYIIEDKNIHTVNYPYDTFLCAECHITPLKGSRE